MLLAALGTAADAADGLEGEWVLDPERSDPARRRLHDAVEEVSRQLRGRRPSPARPSRTGSLGDDLLAPVRIPQAHLTVHDEGETVTFVYDGTSRRRVVVGATDSVVDAANPWVTIAAWEDGTLWVEQTSNRGTRVVEAWSPGPAALRAEFVVRNDLFEEPVRFTLRYVRPAAAARP